MDHLTSYHAWLEKETKEWSHIGHDVVQQVGGIENSEGTVKSYWVSDCFAALQNHFNDCMYLYTYNFQEVNCLTQYVEFMYEEVECRFYFVFDKNQVAADLCYKTQEDNHYEDFLNVPLQKKLWSMTLGIEEKYNIIMEYMMNMPHIRLRFAVGNLTYEEDSFFYEYALKKLKSTKEAEDYVSEE